MTASTTVEMKLVAPDMTPIVRLLDELRAWLARFDATTVGRMTRTDRRMLHDRLLAFMTDLADAYAALDLDIPADTWGDLLGELDNLSA